MGTGEHLTALAAELDDEALGRWLATIGEGRRPEVAAWLAEHGDDVYGEDTWQLHEDWQRQVRRPAFRLLLELATLPPGAAARTRTLERVVRLQELLDLVHAVVDRREEPWVQAFVVAAAAHPPGSGLHPVLARLVVDRGLPVPEGAAFVSGWVATVGHHDLEVLEQRVLDDPLAPLLVHRYLVGGHVGEDPRVLTAVPALVREGRVDRERVVAEVLDLLLTGPRPEAQRALAALLAALGAGLGDLPGGLSFAQGLIASNHGSVGAYLLPLVLPALGTADDLLELTTTIAGRPEKAQKTVLLKALSTDELVRRLGAPAVVDALQLLTQSTDDMKLRGQVERRLAALGSATTTSDSDVAQAATGLWDLAPEAAPHHAAVLPEVTAWSPEGQERLRVELAGGEIHHAQHLTTGGAVLLADLVALHHEKGDGVVLGALRRACELWLARPGPYGDAVTEWLADPSADAYHRAAARAGELRMEGGWAARPYSLNSPSAALVHLHARETLMRLGSAPCLLSTPSRSDHTITLDVLADRIRRCAGASAGPLDLLLALHRLRPVDPSEASLLDGLALPVDESVTPTGAPTGLGDAVDVVRAWVAAGGLPAPRWSVPPVEDPDLVRQGHRPQWVNAAEPPAPEGLLALAPRGHLNDDRTRYRSVWARAIVPWWPDLLIEPFHALSAPMNQTPQFGLEHVLTGWEAPLGPPSYDILQLRMVGTDRRDREAAARMALTLVAEGRFDADHFTEMALTRLGAGLLPLARVTAVWELMAQAGGLRSVWPVMVGVADAACSSSPVAAGTADLLRTMGDLVHEVPQPTVPEGVRALAAKRGSSKAQAEARRLVDRVDRVDRGDRVAHGARGASR